MCQTDRFCPPLLGVTPALGNRSAREGRSTTVCRRTFVPAHPPGSTPGIAVADMYSGGVVLPSAYPRQVRAGCGAVFQT